MFNLDSNITIFVLLFLGGVYFYRILFLIIPKYFNKPATRTLTGLNWHHHHYGVLLTGIGIILVLANKQNLAIYFLAIGFGLIVDWFIDSLLLKTKREDELKIYKQTLMPTTILVTVFLLLIYIFVFLL